MRTPNTSNSLLATKTEENSSNEGNLRVSRFNTCLRSESRITSTIEIGRIITKNKIWFDVACQIE
jgi:hypothetical protein